MTQQLHVRQAAVRDEFVLDSRRKVVTCLIDPEDLASLYIPWYQREEGKDSPRRRKLREGVQTGGLPDMLLNYRGEDITDLTAGELLLPGVVSVIDGFQRVATTQELLAAGVLGGNSRDLLQGWLGAKIFVGLDEDDEYRLFGPFNRDQWRLGPAVTIRNELQRLEELQPLVTFAEEDSGSIIAGRIQWRQQPQGHELFGAKTYLSVIMALHSSYVPTDIALLLSGTREAMVNPALGADVIVANLKTFFGLVDTSFGLHSIPPRRTRGEYPYIKNMFLIGLARFLATHKEFWDGELLDISKPLAQRLRSFRFTEPVKAATTSNNGGKIISQFLVTHFVNPSSGSSKPIELTDRRR